MKLLLLGSTGLLGRAVAAEARNRGLDVIAVARSGAPVRIDITDQAALAAALDEIAPDLVFNCAGLVDIEACERDPGLAYRVNARPLALLAQWSRTVSRTLIHVSTDHFFIDGGDRAHAEDDPVGFANEYARTKFAGEAFALTSPRSFVLRTSIVGIRGWAKPTFAEWAIGSILGGEPMTLFSDAFSSSLDAGAFARAALDLAGRGASGLLNLAAGEVYSKEAFVRELASELGEPLRSATIGSVTELTPKRAESLGLDVGLAEKLLEYKLPGLKSVVAAIVRQYRKRVKA